MNSRWWRLFDRALYQLRWIGPPAYLGLAVYMGWLGIGFIPDASIPNQLLGWGFLAVGLWSLRQSYKEFREARDAEPPSGLPDLPDPDAADRPEWRHPLTAEQMEQLLSTFALLKAAGVVDPDEVTDDEVVECAERTDVFEDMDFPSVLMVLEELGDERDPPFRHLAFFVNQEFYDDDAFEIVREFARLSGYTGPLRQIRCDLTGDYPCGPDYDPAPNAVIEFEMGAARYSLPFTMYRKYLPNGLIEQLAPIVSAPERAERFYQAWRSDNLDITYASPAKIEELNAALGPDPFWVPL